MDEVLQAVQAHDRLDVKAALAYARRAGIVLFESELQTLANLDTLDDARAMERLIAEVAPESRVILDAILQRMAR